MGVGSGREILARLVALEHCTWRYRDDPSDAWHLGPMAQDFRASFGLGHFDPDIAGGREYIETVDHLGVHGVAIQQLHRMVVNAHERIEALEQRLDDAAPQ